MIPTVDAWRTYLTQQVGHAPFTGQDSYGEATYGTTTWYPAHLEQAILSQGGVMGVTTVTGALHIILGAAVAIDPQDKVLVRQPFTTRNSTGAFSTEEEAQVVRVAASVAPIMGHHHTEFWTE